MIFRPMSWPNAAQPNQDCLVLSGQCALHGLWRVQHCHLLECQSESSNPPQDDLLRTTLLSTMHCAEPMAQSQAGIFMTTLYSLAR